MIKILFAALAFSFLCNISFSQTIVIANQYEASVHMAKEQNKKILLVFTADYCIWCNKFKKETLENNEFIINSSDYIICYIDIKNLTNKDLIKLHKVRTIPAYRILNMEEEVLKSDIGYKSKDEMLFWLKQD
jgi:thioredoxin-related protein